MKAMIGMSGGVDSSVAAFLTQRSGAECVGAIMRLHDGGGTQDVADAQAVAKRMGMDFHVLDFSEDFRRAVMDHFAACYLQGLTPNPCVVCNRHLKFGRFLESAQALGCDTVVTGHYARVKKLENGRYRLEKAVDEAKDQTYFLYALTQDQLSHIRLPLGELTKQQVRQIAQEQGFLNAKKRDSQDICFIPDGDYLAFLQRHTGIAPQPGQFLDEGGRVVGTHRGAAGYTLGQRKGVGLAMGAPVYVCGKDMASNTVTVGPNESLFCTTLLAEDWIFSAIDAPLAPIRCQAKTRSRMAQQPATLYPEENGIYRLVFDEPQRAITPGQAVVLYDGNIVLGGGTITKVP